MSIVLKNNAASALSQGINNSQTSIDVLSGAVFPNLSAGEYFYATIESTESVREIVKVTNVAGNTLTVVRAQDGTSAASFAEGSRFEARINAASVEDKIQEVRDDLADDNGSSLVGFEQAFAGSVARTVEQKLRDYVSVKDFGAVGDGTTDDSDAIEQAISTGKSLVFPPGTYRITRTIQLGTQKAFVGIFPQSTWVQNGKSTIYGAVEDIGDGNPLFQAAATGSTQALTFENLSFLSNKVVNSNDLSAMDSSGVYGVNVRGVKQGTQFFACSFRNMKSAVREEGVGNYLDKITFDRCHFTGLYLALSVSPTAGTAVTNCYFDECYDWVGQTGRINIHNTRFNNSSYAQEQCQIKGDIITADNIYIEGGNQWFAPTQYLSVRGSYFSEAFSANGATKFSIAPQSTTCYINVEGTRIGTNTRVIALASNQDLSNFSVRFVGLSNGKNFGAGSNVNPYLQSGMQFEGWGNSQTPWNVRTIKTGVMPGQRLVDGSGDQVRAGPLKTGVSWDNSISFNISTAIELEQNGDSGIEEHSYLKLIIVGANNGTGGAIAYHVEITIYKGYGSTWASYITGPDDTDYAVSLTNPTQTSVDVEITESHSGANDTLFIESASPNIKVTF